MTKNTRSCRIAVITCLLFALTFVSVFAGGTGGGNGKNRNIPLTMESSSVTNGASNVAVNETIQLNFNKNICNVTVLANNKKCFHLTDEAGNAVAIRLIFPDNQVQKDYRREVFIQPVSDLEANAKYRVSVDNTLMAKNGTTIDDAHAFTFTTGADRTDQENPILQKLGENIITYETAYGETADSVPVDRSGLDDVSQDQGPDTGSIARVTAIILIALAIGFTVLIILLRRRKG